MSSLLSVSWQSYFVAVIVALVAKFPKESEENATMDSDRHKENIGTTTTTATQGTNKYKYTTHHYIF